MQVNNTIAVILLLCTIIAFTGCTGTPGTPDGTSSVSGTGSATSGGSLVPSPTDVIPDYNMVKVDIGEKDYLGNIPVIFQGGMGQIHVKNIDVTLYRADGQIRKAAIGANKGDEVELEGTKETDRVVVFITMDNGQTYKTNDVLSEYRTRQ
jgi:hypothetical protein